MAEVYMIYKPVECWYAMITEGIFDTSESFTQRTIIISIISEGAGEYSIVIKVMEDFYSSLKNKFHFINVKVYSLWRNDILYFDSLKVAMEKWIYYYYRNQSHCYRKFSLHHLKKFSVCCL